MGYKLFLLTMIVILEIFSRILQIRFIQSYFIMIRAEKIHKSYGELEVLKGVNIFVEKSEVVSVVGSSGAGKTTLLQILGTLLKADSGDILINNTNIRSLSDKNLAHFRNTHIGFVFQFHHLLPEFTALENVCIPAYIGKRSFKETESKAMELLEILNVKDRHKHKPNELSGGEKQRVAIARALINNPSVILADEPSGNLDSKNAEDLYKIIFQLRDSLKQTFVIVTHNEVHAKTADRMLTIADGKME
jgi:lipoprotein-releasing system ATP-binding protein